MKPLRYGVIGTGLMGCGHIGSIAAIRSANIVATADPHAASRKAAVDALTQAGVDAKPIPTFRDYRDLLADSNVDAVVVATPTHTHCQIALDALAAGKHVLCEKPMALTIKECDLLIAAAEKSGRVLQVGLELRHAPLYRRFKELLAGGVIGRPWMLWCLEFRGPFLRKVDDWIIQKRYSGGSLVDKNCHHFDLFTWLADSDPVRVSAFGGQDVAYRNGGLNDFMRTRWPDRKSPSVRADVLDNAWVLVEFANGARASLGVCFFAPDGRDMLELGVIGSAGRLQSSETRGRILQFTPASPDAVVHRPYQNRRRMLLSHRGAVWAEHRAFIECVRRGVAPLTDGRAGRMSLATALAAELAVAEGRIVELDEVMPGKPGTESTKTGRIKKPRMNTDKHR